MFAPAMKSFLRNLNYSINSLAASPTAPNLDTATPSRQAGSQAGEQRNTEGQAAQGKAA
jgi:hypothetical protein